MSERLPFDWHAEVERLRATSSELGPEARVAIREVLLSVLAEDPLEPRLAESARSLLAVLGRPGAPTPPTQTHPRTPARSGSRVLAFVRGRRRLVSAG
jgi:hypothetical protein